MTIFDLSPEETVILSNVIALSLYKTYNRREVLVLGEFIESIALNLKVLNVQRDVLELQNASVELNNLPDNKDLAERLKVLENLILK